MIPQSVHEHAKRVPFFVYTMKTKSQPERPWLEVLRYYEENQVPVLDQVNGIVVHDVGVFLNGKTPHSMDHWKWDANRKSIATRDDPS